MIKSKLLVIGGGLIILSLVYCLFATIRASKLENALRSVETKYRALEARHRRFVAVMLEADQSRIASAEAKMELLRENLGLTETITVTSSVAVRINTLASPFRPK